MTRLVFALAVFAVMAGAEAIPTFSKDVAPVLYKNCVSCHRAGDIAPMELVTYEQVRPWAKSIREKVSLGEMPPWHANAPHGTFLNDRRLSDRDKDTLLRWAANGAPQGDPKDLPSAPQFAEGWEIGKPDVVIPMTKAYDVPASGTINYQYFTMPTNFTEDKWVQAIEVRPGVRRVVHHILVFCREPGAPQRTPVFTPVVPKLPGLSLEGGRGALIATTAPGTNAMVYQPGAAMLVKAGATLSFQIHYTASGTPATDISSVGMIFAKEPPKIEMRNGAFANPTLMLPAGDPNKAVESAIEFNQDSHVWALFPHTHLRGKSWEYRLAYPDGRTEVVLSVPTYDFNWQTYYLFAKPLAVPKGARLEATAHYDNSTNNKSNPNPKVDVRWGEQTWQEMQYSGITYSIDKPDSTSGSSQTQRNPR
jgi:hypothetical protein